MTDDSEPLGNCKDCRHWDAEYFASDRSARAAMARKQGFGICTRVGEFPESNDLEDFQTYIHLTVRPNALTGAKPPLGWRTDSAMATKPTFGCVQFEAHRKEL